MKLDEKDIYNKILSIFDLKMETGSRVYGNNHKLSDWDCVVFKEPYLDMTSEQIYNDFIKQLHYILHNKPLSNDDFVDGEYYTVYNKCNIFVLHEYQFYGNNFVLTVEINHETVHLIIVNDTIKFVCWDVVTEYTKQNIDHMQKLTKNNIHFTYKILFNTLRTSLEKLMYKYVTTNSQSDINLLVKHKKLANEIFNELSLTLLRG